jgi:hypothetical protein
VAKATQVAAKPAASNSTTVLLRAEGEAPLILHNERMADPLDPVKRALGQISAKTKKTDAEHLEMARLEFLGSLYFNGPAEFKDGHLIPDDGVVPSYPAWNVLRCLQEGAKRSKRGADVLRGIHPLTEYADFIYDGPTDPDEMWASGEFSLRKGVGVGQKKIMRTRAYFWPWEIAVRVDVDPVVWNLDDLATVWHNAGRYAGLGDMRPVYGRFEGTVER